MSHQFQITHPPGLGAVIGCSCGWSKPIEPLGAYHLIAAIAEAGYNHLAKAMAGQDQPGEPPAGYLGGAANRIVPPHSQVRDIALGYTVTPNRVGGPAGWLASHPGTGWSAHGATPSQAWYLCRQHLEAWQLAMEAGPLREWTFDVKLFLAVTVVAESEAAARQKVMDLHPEQDGEPDLVEIDGEAV